MNALSPWIAAHLSRIPFTGPVLDVACGAGRHSLALCAREHRVIAIDKDTDTIAAHGHVPGLTILTADLEAAHWPFRPQSFAGIIVVNYLWRPLFPGLAKALQPGGVLLYDTFMRGNERFGRPRNPDFLLKPGELRQAFETSLETLDYFEGDVELPKPACRQMIAARKPLYPKVV
ncbi:MAG: SAM-dependent methyltransferase [Sneathiella sp.]|jgi:SAM-dependent methyltransferase|uniref:class I SAM-dependent methyltransferase n=1 Tax=Sneathiella sp. TaxID=1964365 RepID=UPI000C543C92|nr:class I SAM-dependent methyltransferase [Sneathiella sp.]MAL78445.1 SAM-dependent methyltransferase [Sneathiella sp.]